MIERRTFLIATASAAVSAAANSAVPAIAGNPVLFRRTLRTPAPFATQALILAQQINSSLANSLHVTVQTHDTDAGSLVPPNDDDLVFGTLDALTGHHPGFAYFGGLPGRLGMRDAERLRWIKIEGAKLWQELQDEAGFTCLIAGTTRRGADLWSSQPIMTTSDWRSLELPCEGVTAKIMSGLGANTRSRLPGLDDQDRRAELDTLKPDFSAGFDRREDRSYCAHKGIAQHGRTLALVMRSGSWERLTGQQRAALQSVALAGTHLASDEASTPPASAYLLPANITTARDRVAEAVLAELSTHDALTQRINGSYFTACRILTI